MFDTVKKFYKCVMNQSKRISFLLPEQFKGRDVFLLSQLQQNVYFLN